FATPAAWLLFVPLVGWLLFQRRLTGRNVLALPGLAHIQGGFSPRVLVHWLPGALFAVGLALCIVALARPRVPHRSVSVESEGLDIVLALDTSGSMRQDDFRSGGMPVNRLQVAKGVMAEFIDHRPHDRIGVVVFGEEAFTQIPLTLDHTTLVEALNAVEIGVAGDRGTAIGSAIAVAAKRLKDLDAPDRVIILLTDGENNAGRISPMEAAEASAALGITIYSVGVASNRRRGIDLLRPGGGPDDRGLTQVAEATGGKYFRATDTSSLQRIYATIDELEPSPAEVRELVDYEERYRYWLVPGVLMLGAGLFMGRTILRKGP
ncbi:MAG: VWA domain-containing protein, partial [Myxococcales bacterium]|nr:VWA domain-containing protein [Myxococcales bacterium]